MDRHKRLVCLLREDAFNGPGGVSVKLPSGETFFSLGMREGERRSFQLDAGEARHWKSDLASFFSGGISQGNYGYQAQLLRGFSCQVFPGAVRALENLCDAVAAHTGEAAIRRACGGLIGLGPGLTPSGDDMFLGFLAALWTRGIAGGEDAVPARRNVELLCALLPDYREKTSLVSWNYLAHAAEGRFSEPVLKILGALFSGDDSSVLAWISHLVHHGASSGRDIFFGLREGLLISLKEAA
ncbi:MAG: DUF2877 domain-containing protein [bacterium]